MRVYAAQRYVQDDYRVVVEHFFDRVNHDVLMDRLAKRIGDTAVLRFIRRYLEAGICGLCSVSRARRKGEPLSAAAGQRVLTGLRVQFAQLRLTINEAKTAVASVFGRKFLGFCFWVAPSGVVKRGTAGKALLVFKQRIRWLTRRTRGRSLDQVVERLRASVLGWKGYFRLSQTPGVFRRLDEWLRHRLRAAQLKHWKRGKTLCRALLALGARPEQAQRVAANSRYELNRLMPIAYFDRLGVSRLS